MLINTHVQTTSIPSNIKSIVQKYKKRADERRTEEMAVLRGTGPKKVTEVLVKDIKNMYECPECHRRFKPQGITSHVRSCAIQWCKKNNIKMLN